MPSPRPDLNGKRLNNPANGKVYLIDQGVARWIPNPGTYNNLFANWSNIIPDVDINLITAGPQITDGAILARPNGGSPIYLVDNGHKRHIANPSTMANYDFNWNTVNVVAGILLNYIPDGPEIV